MFNAQSQFVTFGWWLAWTYLLSLSGMVFVPPVTELDLPWAQFVQNGITVTEHDGETMEVTVRLSESPSAPLNVRVVYDDNTAVAGRDFEALKGGASLHFKAGQQEAVIRIGRDHPDVRIVDHAAATGERSFIARLVDTPALQSIGDRGRLNVTIAGDQPVAPPPGQTRASFVQDRIEIEEKRLPGRPISVGCDSPLTQPAMMTFTLYRREGDGREEIAGFRRELAAGAKDVALQIDKDFPEDALKMHRVVDDVLPEADENYELTMMSSDVYPMGTLALTARNDDGQLQARAVPTENGAAINVLDDGPDWDNAKKRWWEVWGTLPDGRRVCLGPACSGGPPLPLPTDVTQAHWHRRIFIDMAPCEPPASHGETDGDGETGRGGRRRCCRGGGCPAGQGQGQGGGGKCLVGPAVPGDYLIILVNNERLHEPGDRTVDQVREALKGREAEVYGRGAIILNRPNKGEDALTASGGEPAEDEIFRALEVAGEDVPNQLKRIEETIARKRESAKRPDLRAIVVWPERELAVSADGLAPDAGVNASPVSYLLPDADPAQARDVRRRLTQQSDSQDSVTVRSVRASELSRHLHNVMDNATTSETTPPPQAGVGRDKPS